MKIYSNQVRESWIIDRVNEEWAENNIETYTSKIKSSDIIWITANWVWKKTPRKHLASKKVVASIYHIDFDNFDDKQEKDFYDLDQYVDRYHVISLKTKQQLLKLTDKKITSIPFWVNQRNWYEIKHKSTIRETLGISSEDYLVGSFQRDTEGKDLKSPKLIKGPDIFIEIVRKLNVEKENLCVVLAGTRRQYVIEQLKNFGIKYVYFEMADISKLNELYNILDLYIVTSRLEGGPQAILECAVSKTPIISTNVGVAPEILHKDSIFELDDFKTAVPNIDFAYKKSQDYIIPKGMEKFKAMFREVYEN